MPRLLISACVLGLAASAAADPPAANPVVAHYRAYRAALDAGDNATAETEAAAALTASVTHDGDGGRTGVLALNLATIRLTNGHVAQAYAPALQASTIGAQNPAAGVDPLQARLVLGRAELTNQRERDGRQLLLAALPEAASHRNLAADAYQAAHELGLWTTAQNELNDAAQAWAFAIQFSPAAPQPDFARGTAQVERGAALFLSALNFERQRPPPDQDASYEQSAAAFEDAVALLGHYAFTPAPNNDLTVAQSAYASALAWKRAEYAALITLHRAIPHQLEMQTDYVSTTGPVCKMRMLARPAPRFPMRAIRSFSVGTVIVRLSLDTFGRVADRRIAAFVPQDRGFSEAVENVMTQWIIERDPTSEPGCSIQPIMYVPVVFSFS